MRKRRIEFFARASLLFAIFAYACAADEQQQERKYDMRKLADVPVDRDYVHELLSADGETAMEKLDELHARSLQSCDLTREDAIECRAREAKHELSLQENQLMKDLHNYFGTYDLMQGTEEGDVRFERTFRKAMEGLDEEERFIFRALSIAGFIGSTMFFIWIGVTCCMCVCGYDTVVHFYTPACHCCFTRCCWPIVCCWSLCAVSCTCMRNSCTSCMSAWGYGIRRFSRRWCPCCRGGGKNTSTAATATVKARMTKNKQKQKNKH